MGKLLEWLRKYLVDREKRTTIKNANCNWCKVSRGVSQESLLTPIMFTTCINNIFEEANSYINVFADYPKVFKTVNITEAFELLHKDLN